ncbi:MAG: hypothetical protein QM809_19045 [Gordonia sp. (in: high G+C Gram-positive bacteria)]
MRASFEIFEQLREALGVGAVEVADVDGAGGGDGLDPGVGLGGEGHVASRTANAEGADPVGVDVVADGDVRDGGLDVLDAGDRVLQLARGALALALVRRVEDQGDETGVGEDLRIIGRRLLLDAADGVADHDGRVGAVALGEVHGARDLEVLAGERHVLCSGHASRLLRASWSKQREMLPGRHDSQVRALHPLVVVLLSVRFWAELIGGVPCP